MSGIVEEIEKRYQSNLELARDEAEAAGDDAAYDSPLLLHQRAMEWTENELQSLANSVMNRIYWQGVEATNKVHFG